MATALSNVQRRLAAPMFAPILNNLVVIAVLLSFPHPTGIRDLHQARGNRAALWLLGLGTTAGVAAMALAQLGIATSTAKRWHAALGGDRALYVRLLAEDSDRNGDECGHAGVWAATDLADSGHEKMT
jgi:peptidoglycan biosynthesis protein MviN/MurJ (putative lipid II flippase)